MRESLVKSRSVWLLLYFAMVAVQSDEVSVDSSIECAASAEVEPICGFYQPEDLEVMPGEKIIVVSEYGGISGSRPASLLSYRPADGTIKTLFPIDESNTNDSEIDGGDFWGDPNCPGNLGHEFAPHGIHHSEIGGIDRLLVVNHGARESIELFEVHLDDSGESIELTWRGCVEVPDYVWPNDVIGLPGGGMMVSHMIRRGTPIEEVLAVEKTKEPSGAVMRWTSDKGWDRFPNSDGAVPNGLEISEDGQTLFANYYLGDEVRALKIPDGEKIWQVSIESPDNTSWAPDGNLLVTSHLDDLKAVFHCSEAGEPVCDVAYSVYSINPATGEYKTVLTGAGAPMAGATVAVQIGNDIYLGSFAGDRIGRRRLSR